MVVLRDLVKEAKLPLFEVREVWYSTLHDHPGMGVATSSVSEMTTKGVYSNSKIARNAVDVFYTEMHKVMDPLDEFDEMRIAAQHGATMGGGMDEVGWSYLIFKLVVRAKELSEKGRKIHWIRENLEVGTPINSEKWMIWNFPDDLSKLPKRVEVATS